MAYGTINTDKLVGSSGGTLNPDSSVFRNRIINGAMVIDQRNAGASVTNGTSDSFPVDRMRMIGSQASKFTAQRSTTTPAGFINSVLVTSSSAYSVGSAERFIIGQYIEGFNVADFGWGTANAQTVTLSFQVRSSLTGTFGGAIRNSAGDRSYPFSYTISSANTWEQKSVTIIGDTTGTWLTDNNVGINISFNLGSGSTLLTTGGSWAAGSYFGTTGSVSVVGTNGATFYITGVQLEKGSTATSFDYRPYGTELQLCQRYFYFLLSGNAGGAGQPIGIGSRTGATQINACIPFPVTMRTAPTLVQNTGTSYYQLYLSTGSNNIDSFKVDQVSTTNYLITNNSALSGMTVGQAGVLYANNASCYIGFTAEL